MKGLYAFTAVVLFYCLAFIFSECHDGHTKGTSVDDTTALAKNSYGGFDSQVKWGDHLVQLSGCNDCHTPKKMGAQGPEPDLDKLLSGHPSQMPIPDIDAKLIQSKGLSVTSDLTCWIGPWGVSFASNLTPDSAGIGNWKEDQFLTCIKTGKWMGLKDARSLLPPMPWQEYAHAMSDDELKAIFAYLKSTKPIHNVVAQAQLPVIAMPGK